MILKEVFSSIYTNEEVLKYLPSTSFVEGVEPLSGAQYYVDKGVMHVKTDGTKKAYIQIPCNLAIGDILELECEVMNITGVKAKLSVSETTDFVTTSNVYTKNSTKSNEWENISINYVAKNTKFVGTNTGNHIILLGVYYREISEFYVRNISWKIKKKVETTPKYELKTIGCSIEKNGSGTWTIHSATHNIGNCTFTEDTTTLTIKWTDKFVKYPIISLSQDYVQTSYLCKPVKSANYNTQVKIRFVKNISGVDTLVNLADVPNYTRFDLMCFGEVISSQ